MSYSIIIFEESIKYVVGYEYNRSFKIKRHVYEIYTIMRNVVIIIFEESIKYVQYMMPCTQYEYNRSFKIKRHVYEIYTIMRSVVIASSFLKSQSNMANI